MPTCKDCGKKVSIWSVNLGADCYCADCRQKADTAKAAALPATPAQTVLDPEVEAFKAENTWFVAVRTSDGQHRLCTKQQLVETFRKDIIAGVLNSASLVEVHSKTPEGNWVKAGLPLAQFAKGHFGLRVLYEPVWSHAVAGLRCGALLGIGLKFLDTLILLGSINPAIAFMFVLVAAACAIPRLGLPAMIMVSIMAAKFTSANLFVTLVTVMLVGSILGCLPGMAIGGAIGLVRRKKLPVAGDSQPEREALPLKAFGAPLLGGAGLWAIYIFVFNPWLISVLNK